MCIRDSNYAVLKVFITVFSCIIIAVNMPKVVPKIDPLQFLVNKQQDFIELSEGKHQDAEYNKVPVAGSSIAIPPLTANIFSIIKSTPNAIINTLFRPFLWESKSVLMFMASMENAITIIILTLCIIYRKKNSEFKWDYIMPFLLFVVFQYVIIGLTTPIMGAIVRYKLPALLILLIIALHIVDHEKIKTLFTKS